MSNKIETNYPDPGFLTKTSMIQLTYGVLINLTSVTTGLAFSFTAVMIPQLSTIEPKVPTTLSDETWIVGVLPLSSIIGNVLSGFLMDTYGRCLVLTLCEIPMAVGWIYTGLAKTATHIIIGRIILGLGCGMGMVPPRAYVTEIALPNLRGVIGNFPNIALSLGIAVQAGLGSLMRWRILSFINGIYSIGLFILSFFFPETPYFILMRDDTPENAEVSLKKFRSANFNVEAEMEQLLEFKEVNRIRRLHFKEQLRTLCGKSACKPYWTITFYTILAQLSGITLVMMWTTEMLEESKSSVDPSTGNMILGFTRLFAGLGTSILIMTMGRRPLALISSFGVSVVCLILGILILNTKEHSVFPLIFFVAYVILASIGYYPIPMLVIFELSPLQIRGILGGISIATANLIIFLINTCYLSTEKAIGFYDIMFLFGGVSFLGTIYLYFYLPETKDLTLQEIEEFYNERRPTLTSQRRIASMQVLSRRTGGSMESRSLLKIR